MIKIHRALPVVEIDQQLISLSKDEHRLLVTLGMMDNRVAPRNLLLEAMCEGRVQILADQKLLTSKLHRLRKKIGPNRLKYFHKSGYILLGSVYFIGEPVSDNHKENL
jgi:DNA-binding response OmpR family regulator